MRKKNNSCSLSSWFIHSHIKFRLYRNSSTCKHTIRRRTRLQLQTILRILPILQSTSTRSANTLKRNTFPRAQESFPAYKIHLYICRIHAHVTASTERVFVTDALSPQFVYSRWHVTMRMTALWQAFAYSVRSTSTPRCRRRTSERSRIWCASDERCAFRRVRTGRPLPPAATCSTWRNAARGGRSGAARRHAVPGRRRRAYRVRQVSRTVRLRFPDLIRQNTDVVMSCARQNGIMDDPSVSCLRWWEQFENADSRWQAVSKRCLAFGGPMRNGM